MPNSILNLQVSDTTEEDSSNAADFIITPPTNLKS
jgi:hypothetical protein